MPVFHQYVLLSAVFSCAHFSSIDLLPVDHACPSDFGQDSIAIEVSQQQLKGTSNNSSSMCPTTAAQEIAPATYESFAKFLAFCSFLIFQGL